LKPLAGAALSGVLLLGLTGCGGGAEASWISVPEVFYLRPHGDRSGPENKVPFHVQAEDAKAATQNTRDHRFTVDVRGSEGAVRLKAVGLRKSGAHCTGDTTRLTCEVGGSYDSWADLDRVYPFAAEGGKPGDTGVVRFTYTTKGGKKLTARTRVVVGEPVVELLTAKSFKDVRPGSDLTAPIAVRNTGEVPVKGLGLQLSVSPLDFRQRYANCRYPKPYHGAIAVCRFPELRIAPGETVVLDPAPRLRASTTRMYGSYRQQAWPLDMGPAKYSTVPDGGDAGNGSPLEAEAVGDLKGTFAQGTVETKVLLGTHADYQVSDVELRGDPDDKRTVRLTVRNNGPGNPGDATKLEFIPPPDATVLKEPMEAIDDDDYEPYCDNEGWGYVCDVRELAPGKTRTFEFTLRLGEPGEGTVSLVNTGTEDARRDPNPANDKASVTVQP